MKKLEPVLFPQYLAAFEPAIVAVVVLDVVVAAVAIVVGVLDFLLVVADCRCPTGQSQCRSPEGRL